MNDNIVWNFREFTSTSLVYVSPNKLFRIYSFQQESEEQKDKWEEQKAKINITESCLFQGSVSVNTHTTTTM